MAYFTKPTSRDEFHIAVICALPLEADAVSLLFDQFWDEEGDPFGRANGDANTYITGRIGKHNVVLAVLPNMGTNGAAAAAASMRSSYTSLRLALLVGICGGVPRIGDDDVVLGDVVVSKTIIQYDFGRQYPEAFEVKTTVEDSLGRANKDIRGMLAVFETELMRERLRTKSAEYLKRLQDAAKGKRRRKRYQRPGIVENGLFSEDHIHRHRSEPRDTYGNHDNSGEICDSAPEAACEDLGCAEIHLVKRNALDNADGDFNIFIGRIGSGNTVMKSGKDRDRIASQHNLIAFEMEGAGAWDEVPCLVVKGVCDYADAHKNKIWQDYAAATAACVMKAILDRYIVTDVAQGHISDRFNGNSQQSAMRTITGNTFGDNARILQGDMHTWNMAHYR